MILDKTKGAWDSALLGTEACEEGTAGPSGRAPQSDAELSWYGTQGSKQNQEKASQFDDGN